MFWSWWSMADRGEKYYEFRHNIQREGVKNGTNNAWGQIVACLLAHSTVTNLGSRASRRHRGRNLYVVDCRCHYCAKIYETLNFSWCLRPCETLRLSTVSQILRHSDSWLYQSLWDIQNSRCLKRGSACSYPLRDSNVISDFSSINIKWILQHLAIGIWTERVRKRKASVLNWQVMPTTRVLNSNWAFT